MDFASGYESSYSVRSVDVGTWSDRDELAPLLEFSATSSIDGDAPEIDSADIRLDSEFPGEQYVRVWMIAKSGMGSAMVPLGTYLLQSSGGEESGWASATLYSVLRPAADRSLAAGWYAPSGSDGAEMAASLLSECLDAPVSIEDGDRPILNSNMVADDEPYLSMAWTLLGDGWEIHVDRMGRVSVRPKPTEATAVRESDVIGDVAPSWDLSEVPNAIRVTDGTYTVEVVNDDPSSQTSTASRGRRIDGEDASDTERTTSETLESYARRLLAEQSVMAETVEYEREWINGLECGDMVSVPGHDGMWRIVSQSMEAGCGVTVQEMASREVQTYAQD